MPRWRHRLIVHVFGALSAVALLFGAACAGGDGETAAPAPAVPAAPTAPDAPAAEPTAMPEAMPKPAGPEPKYGGIMRLSNRGDPPGKWEGMVHTTITLHGIVGTINGKGNLVKPCHDDAYAVCPALAESWEVSDDLAVWTFKVRDDVLWHDGTPFTAEDAKWWMDLAANGLVQGEKKRAPARWKTLLGDLKSVEVLDGNRLQVTLNKGQLTYIETLATNTINIAHPPYLMQPEIDKGTLDITPQDIGWIATGPFKMENYEKGSQVQVRRNDAYYEKDEAGRQLPYLDGIDFFILPDPAAMDAAFRADRIDGGTRGGGHYLTPERLDPIKEKFGDDVWFFQTAGPGTAINPNGLSDTPFADARVRRAIYYWMDREAVVKLALGGLGVVSTMYPPGSPFISPDYLTWPGWNPSTLEQDRAEAKRLLTEAGYPDGFETEFLCRDRWLFVCEPYAAQMESLGLKVKLTLVDTATWTKSFQNLDYAVISGGNGQKSPEGWISEMTRHSQNPTSRVKHEDPKVEELFTRLLGALSQEERVKVGREIENYVLREQAYYVPNHFQQSTIAYRGYVKGMPVPQWDPKNYTDFLTVWLDK